MPAGLRGVLGGGKGKKAKGGRVGASGELQMVSGSAGMQVWQLHSPSGAGSHRAGMDVFWSCVGCVLGVPRTVDSVCRSLPPPMSYKGKPLTDAVIHLMPPCYILPLARVAVPTSTPLRLTRSPCTSTPALP